MSAGLDPAGFGRELKRRGCFLFTGVPCSSLGGLINSAINGGDYLISSNEGDAAALCAGLHLGGRLGIVLMQNSGLTNAASPLSSLHHIFRIPLLAFISLRGEPGVKDEPQHRLMGRITGKMLDLLQVRHALLSPNSARARTQLETAFRHIARGGSFAFIVRDGVFNSAPLSPTPRPQARRRAAITGAYSQAPSRLDALRAIAGTAGGDTAILAATGKTGRELCELGDLARNFYMVGSMGCLSSLALGVALARPGRRIIAVDGDGALLMRLGALASVARAAPPNLLHIVLDNGTCDSTGGQPTLSDSADIAGAAAALGYPRVRRCGGIADLKRQLARWRGKGGLEFVHLPVAPGSKHPLGRPAIPPEKLKERFMEFLNG
ncbi:MAG: phosphonopyruvate decarboxylase [Elusimicrobiales bacterium]